MVYIKSTITVFFFITTFYLLSYFRIAETNLDVISAGLVIAPPTTSANAPRFQRFLPAPDSGYVPLR